MSIRIVPTWLVALFLLPIFQVDPCPAAGATLWVANDGADTGTCGTRSAQCRSISQAIENASDGDTIEVGEGRYGDITGTGTFAGGGDEHGQLLPEGIGCIVCITKAVHILSLHGAAVTLIQGVAGTQFNSTVVIGHDGVTFGAKGQGFTLTGGTRSGVSVVLNVENDFLPINIVAPIRIGGNIDIGDGTGFGYTGPNFVDRFCPFCVFTGQVLFSDNEANNNGTGFAIDLGLNDVEPILLQNNVARDGGTGFVVLPGIASEVGNPGPGVIVQYSADGQSPDIADLGPNAIPRFRSFSGNDFFGNDRNRPLLQLSVFAPVGPNPTYNPGPSAHCGVLNVGALIGPIQGVPGPAITLKAPDNFWGSTKGPSATGPGDAVGGACDQNNATTTAKPFAAAFL